MAAKAEALAKQFEAKVQEATGVFDRLSDADVTLVLGVMRSHGTGVRIQRSRRQIQFSRCLRSSVDRANRF